MANQSVAVAYELVVAVAPVPWHSSTDVIHEVVQDTSMQYTSHTDVVMVEVQDGSLLSLSPSPPPCPDPPPSQNRQSPRPSGQ